MALLATIVPEEAGLDGGSGGEGHAGAAVHLVLDGRDPTVLPE